MCARSTMAWGLEARVPFLDKAFLDVAMDIDPAEKEFGKGAAQKTDSDGRPVMEKYILRKAFDVDASDGRVGSFSQDRVSIDLVWLTTEADANQAVSARGNFVAAKGAILRRRRLFLDRRAESPCRIYGLGR
jgi:hypothetical protein